MKKDYLCPVIDVIVFTEEIELLAISSPSGGGTVSVSDPSNSPNEDDRDDEGIGGFDGGESLAKYDNMFYDGEW